MVILAVDTTSPQGSVALVDGVELMAEVRVDAGSAGHSRGVLPAIEFLLGAARLEPAAVEGYGVAVGPGSFTGIRVGISTVQGLALSSERPCVAVTTLDALAAKIAGEAARLVPVVDAFRGEVYAACYDGDARRIEEPAVQSPASLLARLKGGETAFAGDGVPLVSAQLGSFRGVARFPRCSSFLAAAVGRLAGDRIARGEGGPPADLRPLYVRPPQAKLPAR